MRIFILCAAIGVASAAIAEKPAPVRVYCFSADIEAGFTDDVADEMCRAIAKYGKKKKSVVLASAITDAHAVVEFIGITGERVVEESGQKFVPGTGIVWRPDEKERTLEATISIGDYTKEFKRSSTGGAVASGLGAQIEEWIRENRELILEKARQK